MSKIEIIGQTTIDKKIITHNLLNLIQGRIVTITKELDEIHADLIKLHEKYKLNDEEFKENWALGRLGDEEDFFIWEGSLKMDGILREELAILKELL